MEELKLGDNYLGRSYLQITFALFQSDGIIQVEIDEFMK